MICSGYVLAGGRSSRMGRDKALLPCRGRELAVEVARAVSGAAGNAILVGHAVLPSIPDLYPGAGPLAGIITALRHSTTEWNLIVACDLPELTAGFLAGLVERTHGSAAEVILPRGPDGRDQPLCAVYRRTALEALEATFASGTRKLALALAGLRIEPHLVKEALWFQNVNAPQDWAPYAAK